MADESPAEAGLSSAEATHRLATDGPNALPGGQRRTLLAIAGETVREPMFLLLFAAGTLYLMFGDLQEGLTLFGFVLVTLGLTLYGRYDRACHRRPAGSDQSACIGGIGECTVVRRHLAGAPDDG